MSGRFRFKFNWLWVGATALLAWVGFRCWDYYGRPLTEEDLKTASPDRLALGLGAGPMREKVAAKLLDSGPAGWKAIVRALRSPDNYARRQAAQSLATLRYLNLESGIAAALDDDDKLASAYKVAALASNGSRKSMPAFAAFAKSAGQEKHLNAGQQMAADRLADLMASINTPEAMAVLLDLAPTGHPAVIFALTDFTDPAAVAAVNKGRTRLEWQQRLIAELRTPGDPDPGIKALAKSFKGDSSELNALDGQHLARLARAIPAGTFRPGTPQFPALLAGTFITNWTGTRYFDPEPAVAAFLPLIEEQTAASGVQPQVIEEFKRLNGLEHSPMTTAVHDMADVRALVRSEGAAALPKLRELLQNPPKNFGGKEEACLSVVKLSQDPVDVDLVSRHIFPHQGYMDAVYIETVRRLPGGEAMVIKMLTAKGTTPLDLETLVSQLRSINPSLLTPAIRQAAVSACANVDWQEVGQLDPTWCREFGDDDLKEKYALLLGNNRYLGRVSALRLFAASGHKLIGDELKLTSSRGLINEIIACVEVVAENNLVDQLPFVLAKADDNRWRVREAVAYALRHFENPGAIEALAKLKADTHPAVAFTAEAPGYVDFHLYLNGRQHAGPSVGIEPPALTGGGAPGVGAGKPQISAMPGLAHMTAKP